MFLASYLMRDEERSRRLREMLWDLCVGLMLCCLRSQKRTDGSTKIEIGPLSIRCPCKIQNLLFFIHEAEVGLSTTTSMHLLGQSNTCLRA